MTYALSFAISVALLVVLAVKWEIDMTLAGPWAVLMGTLSCLTLYIVQQELTTLSTVTSLALGTFQAFIITAIAIVIAFFRDPERVPPETDRVIVSPADGRVKYVKKIENGEFPFAVKGNRNIRLGEFTKAEVIGDGGVQIGIGLSLTDIHVNRSPVSGRISVLKRISGGFHSLKEIRSLLENERVVAVIEGRDMKIGLVLIASRLVRRIRTYLEEGDTVAMGQRLGMIRFGSQVDLLIPREGNVEVRIKPGERVKAGVSVIASY